MSAQSYTDVQLVQKSAKVTIFLLDVITTSYDRIDNLAFAVTLYDFSKKFAFSQSRCQYAGKYYAKNGNCGKFCNWG